MLKKQVKYIDFNGKEAVETLYFNLTEAEVVRLDVEFDGGLEGYIGNLNPETRPQEILDLFEKVIITAYGVKSEDGRHFRKTDEAAAEFRQSAAYSALFVDLLKDVDQSTAFFNGVLQATAIPEPQPNHKGGG